jgi:hypothetical protein
MTMTITTPSHGDAFHHPNATTTGHGDVPQPASGLHPEWMPLDGFAQAWAAFGAEASSLATFHATSTAFLALAFEASAHQNYASANARSTKGGGSPSLAYTQGIEHALADLNEASQQWKSVLLWLDSLAREARQQAGSSPLTTEQLASLVLAQQQRVLSLILRVQQEYLDVHHEPLLIFLGYLRAPAAEKAGQP